MGDGLLLMDARRLGWASGPRLANVSDLALGDKIGDTAICEPAGKGPDADECWGIWVCFRVALRNAVRFRSCRHFAALRDVRRGGWWQ